MNNCINCGKLCEEKYCDRLCFHGFSSRMYRQENKNNLESLSIEYKEIRSKLRYEKTE